MILKIFSAFGLIAGFSSCLCILFLSLFNRFELTVLEVPLLILMGLIYIRKRGLHFQTPNITAHSFFEIALYLSIVGFAVSFCNWTLQSPHGNWDAWAMWNLRARFLFRGGDHWRDMFSEAFEGRHPDYPLLLPAMVAKSWYYLGTESVIVPILWALLFALGVAAFLFAGLSLLRGRKQACLGTSILLATPFFAQHAASQYADMPLMFYILGTLVLLSLGLERGRDKNAFLFIAGLFCGFAAWTKDEGMLFVFCVLLCWCIYSFRNGTLFSKQTALIVLGIFPGLLTSLLFKFYAQEAGGIYNVSEIVARLSQTSRYAIVLLALFKEFYGFPLVLLVYLLIVGIQPGSKRLPEKLTLTILLMMLTGYILIYLITPHPLGWQLATSLKRLLLQLWPAFLFFFFQIARNPEEIGSRFVAPDSGRQSLYA